MKSRQREKLSKGLEGKRSMGRSRVLKEEDWMDRKIEPIVKD
jgi:hypothetical protein